MRTSHSLLLLVSLLACGGSESSPPIIQPTPVLTSVVITPPTGSVVVGQAIQLSAAPKDQSGNAIAASVAWSSSSNAIATVSGSGLVTGVAAGTALITATATVGSSTVSSTSQVTITPAPVLTSVTISSTSTSVPVGSTVQLTAAPKDQGGNAIAATVTWSSSAPAIAAVNPTTGLVTGAGAGTATITAAAVSGALTVTSTVQLTVDVPVPPALTSVTVAPATRSLVAGTTAALAATPVDQNGNSIAATIAWSSSATGVATVNAAGGVTALTVGTTTITATATANGITRTGTAAIIVIAAPALTSVTIAGTTTMNVGANSTLTAAPRDQDGAAIAASVTWSSSAPAIATVGANTGVVTGVTTGSATITATATSGSTTVQNATVVTVTTPPFPTSVSVTATTTDKFTPASVDIQVGGRVTWTFQSLHDVIFISSGSPANVALQSSGTASRDFNTPGMFNYVCSLHVGMTGTVFVH